MCKINLTQICGIKLNQNRKMQVRIFRRIKIGTARHHLTPSCKVKLSQFRLNRFIPKKSQIKKCHFFLSVHISMLLIIQQVTLFCHNYSLMLTWHMKYNGEVHFQSQAFHPTITTLSAAA